MSLRLSVLSRLLVEERIRKARSLVAEAILAFFQSRTTQVRSSSVLLSPWRYSRFFSHSSP